MKKKKGLIFIVVALLVLAGIVVALFCTKPWQKDPDPVTAVTTAEPTTAPDLLTVDSLTPYTGVFVEDKSDTPVENIAAVTIHNGGQADYQYVAFTVTTEKNTYSFSVSSLLAGSSVTVLNTDKKTLGKDETLQSVTYAVKALYQTPVSLCEDKFKVYDGNGVINVQNISGQDLTGTVTIYYKETDDKGLFGGITYSAVQTGMKNGDVLQRSTAHSGKVINIVYEE